MANDTARVVRDWLAAVLALVGIVGAVGAGVVWVAENSVKDAVTDAVNEAVPVAVEDAVDNAVANAVSAIVSAAVEAAVEPLRHEVDTLKVAQVTANPAVAAVLYPSAPWVSGFNSWVANQAVSPGMEFGVRVMGQSGNVMDNQSGSWINAYREWAANPSQWAIPTQ